MNTLPDNTPILVGIGACQQRCDDPRQALEASELMVAAVKKAATDAGSESLLFAADAILVPKGSWHYSNPSRLIANAVDAKHAQTLLADIGILQQSLVNKACNDILSGHQHIVVVAGGDCKYRELQAKLQGIAINDTVQTYDRPDITLTPDAELWAEAEWNAGLMMPVSYYAMMENSLRKHQGLNSEQHRDEIASLWKNFSEIAVSDDNAWDRTCYSHSDIRDSSSSNRMIAFPYTKRHNSNWHVDQAAGLIFCSIGKARALGISERRWVYPLSGTESNHSTVMSQRAQLHRSPAVRLVAERALTLANKRIDEINFIDFYSCFPVAVRIQAVELGLPLMGNYSLTGGMTFGGGPLNNYAIQALVSVAEKLREHPQASAYVSSISGMMTKYGASVWTGSTPSRPFRFADLSAEVASADPGVALLENAEGIARIVAYTINFGKDAQGEEMPQRAIVVCDIDAHRAVAFSEEADVMQRMMHEEYCGKEIMLGNNGRFHLSH